MSHSTSITDVPADLGLSMPALFMFSLDQNAMIHFESCISLDGNVIDVAYVESGNFLLYSMDAVYVPFSTTAVESIQGQKTRPSVGSLRSTDLGWEKDSGHHQDLLGSMEGYLASIPDDPQSSMPKGKSMREMLYSLEVLRKKDSED